jgi:MazG family protein
VGESTTGERREAILASLGRLYDLTGTLRELCPWDRAQTQEDIVAYTLEETYELVDAVRAGGPEHHDHVRDELGDLLFQVYFLARVAEQAGWYDLGEVAEGIRQKLVRRHPHIFAGATADTPADVKRTWDAVKRHTEGREGIFHAIPASLPGTLYAHKLQQRAATVGFDWREAHEVLDKIREETDEIEAAMSQSAAQADLHERSALAAGPEPPAGPDFAERPDPTERPRASASVAEEVGDLLFSVVNLARKVGADPELELRASAERFRNRVDQAADLAAREGVAFGEIGLLEQEGYYQRAKITLAQGRDGRSGEATA